MSTTKDHRYCNNNDIHVSVTVTVTEALVLRHQLENRGYITESIRILVPVDRMKQKCFQITTKRVHRSQHFSSVPPFCCKLMRSNGNRSCK